MAIFRATIRVVTVYEKDILVEADTCEQAISYLDQNNEWADDGSLDSCDSGTFSSMMFPLRIKKINSISDIPADFGKGNIAWNGSEPVEYCLCR